MRSGKKEVRAAEARTATAHVEANKAVANSLADVVKTAALEASCFSSFPLTLIIRSI